MPEFKVTSGLLTSLPARILFVLLAVLSVAVWVSYHFMTHKAVDDSLDLLLKSEQQEVIRLAKRVDQELKGREVFLENQAAQLVNNQGELKSIQEMAAQLQIPARLVNYFAGYVVVDDQGLIVSDYPQVEGRRGSNVADRDYLIATREKGLTQRSQALMGRFSQVPLFIISTPVAHQGELLGFLIGYQQLDQEPLFQQIRQEFADSTGELLILDQINQLYISAPDVEQLFQPWPDTPASGLLAGLQEGQMKGAFKNSSDQSWLYAASVIPGVEWLLVRKQPLEPLFKPIEALLDQYLFNLLLGLLVISLVLLLLLNWLLAPVYRASRHLRMAADTNQEQQYLPEEGPEDIRSLFRAVNELQRLRADQEQVKEDMISVISHELRTPLTSIRGALSLLKAAKIQEKDSEEQTLLDMADRNTDRLLLLVNDLLDMASLSKGKLQLKMQDINLISLIDQVVAEFSPFARERRIEIQIEALDEPLNIKADPDRLQQVLYNLLSNAVKFSEAGSLVEVKVKQRGQKVRVAIKDQGEGIPLAFQSRVFERFAKGAARPSERSTGLGLAITRDLVKAMQGDIGFASEPGKGSYFFIDLIKVN
ncbi:sensor histidine kinase [Marinospirillum sp.]|uniref:sensor histidine kinase n=1 Tax=Marinospirillum sp. TaxID=2183934 RepID=UPI00286FEA7B|nr:sensor histidine kinase [Marinospirillum sp.]MDR9467228.1 sensor histidine kinase [Marinospirillum sp.]